MTVFCVCDCLSSQETSEQKAHLTHTAYTFQFIAAIPAVIIIVTFPPLRDATAIKTRELPTLAPCGIVHNAIFVVVGQIPTANWWALAFCSVRTCGGKEKKTQIISVNDWYGVLYLSHSFALIKLNSRHKNLHLDTLLNGYNLYHSNFCTPCVSTNPDWKSENKSDINSLSRAGGGMQQVFSLQALCRKLKGVNIKPVTLHKDGDHNDWYILLEV